jgi:DNA-binding NarL/FixJ family response regulator
MNDVRTENERAGGVATGKIGIVLVDDHSVLRQGLAALINAEPDLVVLGEAEGVQQAMSVIEQFQPRIVLVDIALKDGDGLELIRRITDKWPQMLPLVLSMYEETVYAERALRAGARGYVQKVEVAETVMTAIRRVLEGQVYVSQNVAAGLVNRVAGTRRAVVPQSPLESLSDRELQVLRCIGRGMSNRETAQELFISVKTVETHREHLKQKLRLASSGDLLRYAIEFHRVRE